MKDQLSDAEIIAQWMEPKPAEYNAATIMMGKVSPIWWVTDGRTWKLHPRTLTLDALWEVESKLKAHDPAKWNDYITDTIRTVGILADDLIHADAGQKIAALGRVLRPAVEAQK